jgi:N-acylneuraminate cytidylyltransferase
MSLKEKTIFALICAREGSKGLPGKNMRDLDGKPLVVHSIEVAQSCALIDRVFVSTDGESIASVAEQWGAEVPYLRSRHLACDDTPEWFVWRDMLDHFAKNHLMPDAIVVLPPTAPLRDVSDVINTIERFFSHECDGVICGNVASRSPEFNMVKLDSNGACALAVKPETPFSRRQDAAEYFDVNTVCYVMDPYFVMEQTFLFAGRILLQPVPVERSVDIDTLLDFEWAEFLLKRKLEK